MTRHRRMQRQKLKLKLKQNLKKIDLILFPFGRCLHVDVIQT